MILGWTDQVERKLGGEKLGGEKSGGKKSVGRKLGRTEEVGRVTLLECIEIRWEWAGRENKS